MVRYNFRTAIPSTLFCTAMMTVSTTIMAQIPRTMSYQGVLTQSNGLAVPDGNYSLTFKLYSTTSTSATSLWAETQTVLVSKNIFNVILGNVNPIILPFDKEYWLGITIGTGSELTPRIQLTSSPYSSRSIYADTAFSVVGGGTGSGGITGVTAGPGLAGGGTSGNITLSAAIPFSLSASSNNAIVSGTNSGSGQGVYGKSTSGNGVYGTSSATYGAGVYGVDSSTGYGVYGSSYVFDGVYGTTSAIVSGSAGVVGSNTSNNNFGELGSLDAGVYGGSEKGAAVEGYNHNTTNIGNLADANEGVYGFSYSGTGVKGSSTIGNAAEFDGNVLIKGNYTATGTKNAEVKLDNGSTALLYCEEATGVYFIDYGTGQLANGRAHISVDPTFLQTVTVDAQNPMMVFIQVDGDCLGVFVTNQTSSSFDVVEREGGTSNVNFAYRVVCKRKYFEGLRLSTPAQDNDVAKQMMEHAWPEVLAEEKQMAAKIKTMEKQQEVMRSKLKAVEENQKSMQLELPK